MIIRIFKNNNPASFILLPLFAIVLFATSFIWPVSFVPQQIMPLYDLIAIPFLAFPLLAIVITMVLTIAGAFVINYTCNKNELLAKQSFLPALFYIVFMSINTSLQVLHPMLFSNFFLLLAIATLVDSYRKDYAFSNIFNAGVLITISVLFYFPSIFYYPLLYFALIIIRSFSWRDWVVALLGILAPFAFVLTYYFWNDALSQFINNIRSCFHFVLFTHEPLSLVEYLPVIIGALILFISIASVFNISSNSQKSKKSIRLLFWVVFFSFCSFIIAPQNNIRYLCNLMIPFAVFAANYFLTTKKTRWSGLLFFLLIASILFQQVYNFL